MAHKTITAAPFELDGAIDRWLSQLTVEADERLRGVGQGCLATEFMLKAATLVMVRDDVVSVLCVAEARIVETC